MLSPYTIPPSSIVHTKKKQKTSNHTEHDLKMTSNDLKMTSIDLKMTSKESVKNKRNKLNTGDLSDNQKSGRDLIEQAFSSN